MLLALQHQCMKMQTCERSWTPHRVSFLHCSASPCLTHLCVWLCHLPRGRMSIFTMPRYHPGHLFSISRLSVPHVKSVTKSCWLYFLNNFLMYELFSLFIVTILVQASGSWQQLSNMSSSFQTLNKQPVWFILNKINSYLCQCLPITVRKKINSFL